jgi:hypothetical protein
VKLFLRVPERLLHPSAGRHLLSEVGDLFPEGYDLIDQVLLGTVLISHGSGYKRT